MICKTAVSDDKMPAAVSFYALFTILSAKQL